MKRARIFPLRTVCDGACWLLAAVALVLVGTAYSAPAWAVDGLERDAALLRFLDKSTARVDTIEVPVNQTVHIETMELIVRACVERPPEEPPESAAFMDVWERRTGEPAGEIFRGWMFASSPALSAMEHPIYDLWVIDCLAEGEQPSVPSHLADETPPMTSAPPTGANRNGR